MDSTTFQHRVSGRHSLFVRRWLPLGRARAAVQIIHGMAEHGGRYARLAQALTAAGYAVYAADLPGHGRSVRSPDELGHFSHWNEVLAGLNSLRGHIEQELKNPPLFMLGHSMGSFLLQDYLVEHGRGLQGAVLSATTGDMGALRAVGLRLIQLESLWYGLRHRSALAETLSFKDFNKKFKPTRTAFDWLSRDALEVDKYLADARCGFRCSCALWMELMRAGAGLGDPQRLARIPKTIPVLMIAGSEDPVTQGEKGPRALERHYRAANLRRVGVRMYEGARHELFNETCRDQVTQDLLEWLRSCT